MAFKKKRGIPDRWTDYQALGKRIPGTRFIAFKVPLQQSLIRLLPAFEAFGPSELLHLLEEDKQELGLIIDLTFTTRYYKPQDLPPSVQYLKIYTAGHEVPSDSVILNFKRAVRAFLRENDGNEKLIGVHCTHGLNRTGYLVCRYLHFSQLKLHLSKPGVSNSGPGELLSQYVFYPTWLLMSHTCSWYLPENENRCGLSEAGYDRKPTG
uniref:Dual specificity phosphatase 11 (RNA/RNP complex 1-interacting) n=1 Tax=Paramormyrops kingsleyae TaxID=1676925 RepID=A0A3B3S0B4_9TELE